MNPVSLFHKRWLLYLNVVFWLVQLAFEAHDGQKRRSGEPFIIHPVEVARILGELVCYYKLKYSIILNIINIGQFNLTHY